jgi:general secretion pathway protein I
MIDVSGTRPQGVVWRRISLSLKPFGPAISGFTLLEVMVAVSIIAIVFVSVFRLHTQTLTMSSSVSFYSMAPMLAQGKLAELENRSTESFSDDAGDFGEQFPGYSWEAGVSDVESEILEDTATDLKRIDLAVSFEGLVYNLRTYRFLRPVKE